MDVLKLHPCEALFGQHRRRRGRTRLVEALINWAPLGKALSRLFATLSSLFLLSTYPPSFLSPSYMFFLRQLSFLFPTSFPILFFFFFFFFATALKQLLLFYGLYRMIQKRHVDILGKLFNESCEYIYLRMKLLRVFFNVIFSLYTDLEEYFIQIRKTFILFTQFSWKKSKKQFYYQLNNVKTINFNFKEMKI